MSIDNDSEFLSKIKLQVKSKDSFKSSANQMTGFYMRCNAGLKSVNF